jgi:hypothetical protein
MAGAPLGNQNGKKGRLWADAIRRAVARKHNGDLNHGLDTLAEKLIDAVANGDLHAIKEFGDRLDGKPAQALIGGDENDPAIKIQQIERVVRHANSQD